MSTVFGYSSHLWYQPTWRCLHGANFSSSPSDTELQEKRARNEISGRRHDVVISRLNILLDDHCLSHYVELWAALHLKNRLQSQQTTRTCKVPWERKYFIYKNHARFVLLSVKMLLRVILRLPWSLVIDIQPIWDFSCDDLYFLIKDDDILNNTKLLSIKKIVIQQ